jgi:hypothetical protein
MATRIQVRRGTTSEWNTANPILTEGEFGYNTTLDKFKIGDGTSTWSVLEYVPTSADLSTSLGDYIELIEKGAADGVAELNATSNVLTKTAVVFEGATVDAYETTLEVTDPTADRTITLPNSTGTVALTSDITVTASSSNTFSNKSISLGSNTVTATLAELNTAISDANVASIAGSETLTNKTLTSPIISGLTISDGSIIIEGVTADDYETTVTFTDPTADRSITFPDATGTVALTSTVLPLSGGTMTGALTLSGAPTVDLHAATKAYVDAATAGLNVHASVQAATTTNITIATALENADTLDGVTLATGNRVLVKNQTDKTENGIYLVKASGAPDRADDYNTAGEVDAGDFVFVEAGTSNGKTGWIQTNAITTVGSDNIEFTQFSGAGTYVAGTGLTLTGNTFSVNDPVASQSGNSGKYLTTDGTNTSWGTVSGYSAPTLGSTSIASGATVTTIAGLTLTTATLTTPTLTLSSTTSSTDGQIGWISAQDKITVGDGTNTVEFAPSTRLINQQTASYTLGLTDKDKIVEMNVGSANNLTVPLNSTVAYPIGTVIDIVQVGSGQTTVVATGGVTINSTSGLKIRTQWGSASLIKRAENTWVLIGDVAA